jgi:hypothetical protein
MKTDTDCPSIKGVWISASDFLLVGCSAQPQRDSLTLETLS